MAGLIGEVTIQEGIKSDQSTNVYRQALGWLFDSLCFAGLVVPRDDLQIADLARLDWLSRVAVAALDHEDADVGTPHVFPWAPLQPRTIYNRVASLILMFDALCPGFRDQRVAVSDAETLRATTVDAQGLSRLMRARFSDEMTDAHKAFCRRIVAEEPRQRLLLNLHMICWAEAQTRWSSFGTQGHHERMQTINLCVLAAVLALVVHIPFRARTVTEMRLGGDRPDLALPKGAKRIEFHIAPKQMKVPKSFDAVLDDTRESCPRQILDWFIAGPRQVLLENPAFLRNPEPDRLFCGIGTARYNRILIDWTEEIGMRMTTHLFRHALASVLINRCEVSMDEVAGLLGNTVATVEKNYAFHDRVRQRGKTLQKLSDLRQHMVEARHPGRRRKS